MKVAICFRGVHYMNGENDWVVDFEKNVSVFFEKIVKPLQDRGDEVDIFISTYDSVKLDRVKEIYKPVRLQLSPFIPTQDRYDAQYNHHNILFNQVFDYEMEKNIRYNLVITMRFDLVMRISILDLPIRNDVFNAPYKLVWNGDVDETWWVLPRDDLELILMTLNFMRDRNMTTHKIEKHYPKPIYFWKTLQEFVAFEFYYLDRKNKNDRWERSR
jgi:hypothetical protein